MNNVLVKDAGSTLRSFTSLLEARDGLDLGGRSLI